MLGEVVCLALRNGFESHSFHQILNHLTPADGTDPSGQELMLRL